MLTIAALQSVGKRSLSGVSSCMVEASTAAGRAAQGRGGLFRTLHFHLLSLFMIKVSGTPQELGTVCLFSPHPPHE